MTKEEIKTALEARAPRDWTRHARMDWWWCKQGYFRWAVKRHHEGDGKLRAGGRPGAVLGESRRGHQIQGGIHNAWPIPLAWLNPRGSR